MHSDCPTATNVEQDDAMDEAIMGLLLIDHPGLWSVGEVERSTGDPIATKESLDRLVAVGLVHRLEDFVLATRSAARAGELHG
jgi:hypothetical protein